MKRWFQEATSPYPWEQDGLDHVRRLLPDTEPYRAWATFSFTARSGRINECDLLVAVPGGLHLVELKGHPGSVVNRGDTWQFRQPGENRPRTLRNPLHLVDLKSKELRGQLEWALRRLRLDRSDLRVPRVEPSVFLSAPGLRAELDEVQRTRVYGRDGDCEGLPWIWRDLLNRPPQSEGRRLTPEFSRRLPDLLAAVGISASTAHLRFADGWVLSDEPLDTGPSWEDRLAERSDPVREQGRVRIYLTAAQATDEQRQSVERAARREYQVLQGINHRGIARAVQIGHHQGGPAIRFEHRATDLRLDSYLAVFGDSLTPETRLDLVRQLAEALRYAHGRSLYHRALAARSVYVSARDDGSAPVLRVIDWQAAARRFDTPGPDGSGPGSTGLTPSGLTGRHLADAAEVYLAPEFHAVDADPVDLDTFGLGAVAYLILTGQPPAATRAGLIDRLTAEGGLHLYAVSDGVSGALDELIHRATSADPAGRLASPEEFLAGLDEVEQDSPAPEPDVSEVDPLTATTGQRVDGRWTVARVLGTGSTARALLVEHAVEDDDGTPLVERKVLKVALDEDRASRLHAEARALRTVGGGVVVTLLDEPRELGGRTVLDLEYAGDRTLGARLRAEGRLTYHELERFGGDLFTALDQLAGKGVRHRDLKPDNLGVFFRADRSWQLKLFDFSLAEVSERDIEAGTRGYLDPFLGTARRPTFDDHAERYAAAVTLHEMASAERPVWGDGVTDPRTSTDEVPALSADLFEPALRDGLTAFFRRALHRDTERRFDTFGQMESAWRAVFAAADATAPATTPATVGTGGADDSGDTGRGEAGEGADPGGAHGDTSALELARDRSAAAAGLDTPLDAAGLSPRAVSVAHGFGATTVGGLLDVPQYQIFKARGAGAVVRKELNRRHRQWAALREPAGQARPAGPTPDTPGSADGTAVPGAARSDGAAPPDRPGGLTVDELADRLLPAPGRKGSRRREAVRLTLGLPDGEGTVPPAWPVGHDVAVRLGITEASVSRHRQDALREWAGHDWLRSVRDELVDTVAEAGRVMTATELAGALRARYGAGPGDPGQIMARALGVVRAAVDTEIWVGLNAPDPGPASPAVPAGADGAAGAAGADGGDADGLGGAGEAGGRDVGGRLAMCRRGQRVLVTLESLPGTDDPSPPELADYALALGRRADELAGADPLPGPGVVVRELRAVPAPEGLPVLADTRLVDLASAVSERAAASPRLEFYPRDLPLARALRLAQAAAGVRRDAGISVAELQARVLARFPELVLPGRPSPVRLAEALDAAGFPLVYDPADRRFRPAPTEPAWPATSSSTAMSGHDRMTAAGLDPVAVAAAKLDTSVRRGGFLVLTLRATHLPGAAAALAAAYPVTPVDVSRAFLAELRALAAERGQDWDRVLSVDARFSRSGRVPPNLAGYLRAGWQRVAARLEELAAGERTVLFWHNAGLLARYFDSGGRELLTGWQHAARRADQAPHGLWLLCPADSARDSPRLDGRTVEWLDASEWTSLGRDFWERLGNGHGFAA